MDSVSCCMLTLSLPSRYVFYTTRASTIEVHLAWYVMCVAGCRSMVRTEVVGGGDDLLV